MVEWTAIIVENYLDALVAFVLAHPVVLSFMLLGKTAQEGKYMHQEKSCCFREALPRNASLQKMLNVSWCCSSCSSSCSSSDGSSHKNSGSRSDSDSIYSSSPDITCLERNERHIHEHHSSTAFGSSPDELVSGFWELEGDGQTVQLWFGFCKIPLVCEPARAWKLVHLQHVVKP